MEKEKIYIDLSKCMEEELKNIYTILGDTLKFISPSIVFNFPIMHYHEGMWIRTNFFQDKAKEDSFLEDKTELLYPEFIKLFEGGDDNNGWIKIESETDLPKENGVYWTYTVDNNMQLRPKEDFIFNGKFNKYFTHYQPIVKPEPPKF